MIAYDAMTEIPGFLKSLDSFEMEILWFQRDNLVLDYDSVLHNGPDNLETIICSRNTIIHLSETLIHFPIPCFLVPQ